MSQKYNLGKRINNIFNEYKNHESEHKIYSEIINVVDTLEINSEHKKIGIIIDAQENNKFYIIKPKRKLIRENKLKTFFNEKNPTLETLIKIANEKLLPGDDLINFFSKNLTAELSKYGLTKSRKLLYPIVIISPENQKNIEKICAKSIIDYNKIGANL